MMDRQLAKVGMREFPTAPTTDPRIDLQRLLSIALFALFSSAAGLGHYAIKVARVFRFHDAILIPSSWLARQVARTQSAPSSVPPIKRLAYAPRAAVGPDSCC